MEKFAVQLGLTSYYIQCSQRDLKFGRIGSRSYYWVKDLQVPTIACDPPKDSLLCLVDVDQYLNMPRFLVDHFQPTIIYTFQPSAVSRIEKNYSYTFDKDNNVNYTVTDGSHYKHLVWNYSNDHLKIVTYINGFNIMSAVTYLVDRRATSIDHEIILLTPLGRWRNFGAFVFNLALAGDPLKRLCVATSVGYNRLLVKSQAGVVISTGVTGEYLSTTVPVLVDDALAGLASTSKYDLSLPQVQGFVHGEKEDSIPLLGYHRKKTSIRPDQVCPVSDAVRSFQFQPDKFIPEAKAPLHPFMNPFLHGAFCPSRTKANEEECVRERVIRVQPDELNMTPYLFGIMREYVKLLVPKPHQLHPTDFDTVLDRQFRPAQRQSFWRSSGIDPTRILSMFIKSESYGNIKPPRPISTINPIDKAEYSRYMYALEIVMKSQPWYAFALSPRVISARVVKILSQASFATPTDFSKFDGHGSNLMRTLERMILLRSFHQQYHKQLIDIHESQFNLKAYGKFGTWYQQGFSRASGSPETSIFNTTFNAFITYLARRLMCVDGANLSPKQAWDGLGIYGGDDGLTADTPSECLSSAAKWLGQELTIKVVPRGKFGIIFLARVYSSNVWDGDMVSCCDIPRQLSKLHATVNLPCDVTPQEKFLEKIRAYSITDPYTPIIGDLCRRVILLHGTILPNPKTDPMKSWLTKFDMDRQYYNEKTEWMMDYVTDVLPDFNYRAFLKWLSDAKTVEHLMAPPMFIPPPEAVSINPVVVDDEIIPRNTIVREPRPIARIPHIARMREFVDRGWPTPPEWREILHKDALNELDPLRPSRGFGQEAKAKIRPLTMARGPKLLNQPSFKPLACSYNHVKTNQLQTSQFPRAPKTKTWPSKSPSPPTYGTERAWWRPEKRTPRGWL